MIIGNIAQHIGIRKKVIYLFKSKIHGDIGEIVDCSKTISSIVERDWKAQRKEEEEAEEQQLDDDEQNNTAPNIEMKTKVIYSFKSEIYGGAGEIVDYSKTLTSPPGLFTSLEEIQACL